MDLVGVITQLKTYATVFDGRVAGAAEWSDVMEGEFRPELYPAAYVVPLSEDADENDEQNALYQTVTEHVGIIVAFDNTADRRGQSVTQTYAAVKASIYSSILNWRGTDPQHALRGFEYVGGRYLDMDRARLFYQYEFSIPIVITTEDGWQVDAPYLTEIDANSEEGDPAPPFKYVAPQPAQD